MRNKPRIHCLQHVPFEGPAAIADWAARRGHGIETTRLYAGEPLPGLDTFELLLVMGGPMGIQDEVAFPWLGREKVFLRQALDAGKLLVGVCLGAQLLADALGARVYRGPCKEIGWLPIELTAAAAGSLVFGHLPKRLDVFHWHGDTFDLPPGALYLASSAGCVNQAFLFRGRVLGLQFHMESTPASVRALVENCGEEILDAPYIQSAERILSAGPEVFEAIHAVLFGVLDRMVETKIG